MARIAARMTVTASTQPTILIIDDDAAIGRSLKRLSEQAFPGFQITWVKNGVTGIELARQYADQLRLVVLDIKMDLLDGTLAAVQIRRAVPHVPIVPFTSHAEALPTLADMGCVQPVLKRPDAMREMPERMRQAMAARITPLPVSDWVMALQRSGDSVLAFVQHGNLQGLLVTDGQTMVNVQRATHLLEKYCRRISTPAAREIQLARKALQEVVGE
jgi:DNA-binding response OmpR family regulator